MEGNGVPAPHLVLLRYGLTASSCGTLEVAASFFLFFFAVLRYGLTAHSCVLAAKKNLLMTLGQQKEKQNPVRGAAKQI